MGSHFSKRPQAQSPRDKAMKLWLTHKAWGIQSAQLLRGVPSLQNLSIQSLAAHNNYHVHPKQTLKSVGTCLYNNSKCSILKFTRKQNYIIETSIEITSPYLIKSTGTECKTTYERIKIKRRNPFCRMDILTSQSLCNKKCHSISQIHLYSALPLTTREIGHIVNTSDTIQQCRAYLRDHNAGNVRVNLQISCTYDPNDPTLLSVEQHLDEWDVQGRNFMIDLTDLLGFLSYRIGLSQKQHFQKVFNTK